MFYRYGTKAGGTHEFTSEFKRDEDAWQVEQGGSPNPGLVLYAQVDGGFSVWDPARNYWKGDDRELQTANHFQAQAVWDGLPLHKIPKQCNGLIADWVNWQLEGGEAFEQLCSVLKALSPSRDELLEPGDRAKISLEDARRHPTIKMPYGQDAPLVHASAGFHRIVSIAYLLVWTWQEHIASANLRGDGPAREIVFLVDEIEAHLHPQLQRRIVPALLDVIEALTERNDIPVQLIAATHSPLVLASAETKFDVDKDAVWKLDLVDKQLKLSEFPWDRQGDANAWLTSELFDLKEPRSLEAEEAIVEALALLRQESPSTEDVQRVNTELQSALGPIDPFWTRWSKYRDSATRR